MKKNNKWNVINTNKYPTDNVKEIIVEDFAPSMKIIEYEKNDLKLYYFKHGTLFFLPANWDKDFGVFKVFNCVFRTIEEHIKKENVNKKIAFELTEFEQLNKIVEYMINRFGYNTIKENNFIVVNKK